MAEHKYREFDEVIMKDGRHGTILDVLPEGKYNIDFSFPDVSIVYMTYTDDDILRPAKPGDYDAYIAWMKEKYGVDTEEELYSLPEDYSYIFPEEERQRIIEEEREGSVTP